MKNFKTILFSLMAVLLLGNFSSCSSSDDNDGDTPMEMPKYAATAAKYEITDANAKVASIEFTESGQYVVVMNNAPQNAPQAVGSHKMPSAIMRASSEYVGMYYGDYTIDENGNYVLQDFGTVKINKDSSGTVVSVTIHSNKYGETWTCHANLYTKINANNSLSDRICRTWNFKSVGCCIKYSGKTLDETASSFKELFAKLKAAGVETDGDDDEIAEIKQFIFTKSGSLIIKSNSAGLAVLPWKWTSNSSSEILVNTDYEWSSLFDQASSTKVSFKSGQLVLKEEGPVDEDEPSITMGWTITFEEAK